MFIMPTLAETFYLRKWQLFARLGLRGKAMIQNFANQNAEEVFLGYAPEFGSVGGIETINVLTADLRFLDAITTERDLFAVFGERVQSIQDVDNGKRILIVEPPRSQSTFRIEFILRSGDVFDLAVAVS